MNKVSRGLLLAGAGLLYLIWIRVTGIMIPCPFRFITGIRCPGCGVTTMILAASKGDFRTSFEANPFLFVTAPYFAALLIHRQRLRAEGAQERAGWKKSEWIYLICLLAFGVWRGLQDLLLII